MARKLLKTMRSKGERLGWTPLDKVSDVSLSNLIVRGKRVNFNPASDLDRDRSMRKLLIP